MTRLGFTSAPAVLSVNVNVTGYGQDSPQGSAQHVLQPEDSQYLVLSSTGGDTVVMSLSNQRIIQHLRDSEGNGIPLYAASISDSLVLHITVSHYIAGEWFQLTLLFKDASSAVNLGSPSLFYALSPGEVSNLSIQSNPQNGLNYMGTSSHYFTTQGLKAQGADYAYLLGPYSHQFLPNDYLKFFDQPYYTNTTLVPGVSSSNPHSGNDAAAGFSLDFGLSSFSGVPPLSSLDLTVYVPVT